MTVIVTTDVPGSRTLLGAGTEMNTLANGNYVSNGTITAAGATDIVVEVAVTPGTVSGNKQLLVFVQVSMDNTNFSTGPTSGTTTTDQVNLKQIGVLPLNTNSTLQRDEWSLKEALGFVPAYAKVIVFNDSGAALAGSGNTVYYQLYNSNSQ